MLPVDRDISLRSFVVAGKRPAEEGKSLAHSLRSASLATLLRLLTLSSP